MCSVSVVIPCFNHQATLPRAVASCLAQEPLLEVIIVDDHSTDASLEVAWSLAKEDARIRVIQTPFNAGPGGARNAGARIADGAYLSFLDADDELMGSFFREALDMLACQPEMGVVKGEMEFFDPVKGYILPSSDPRHQSAVLSSSCGMVMRRDLFSRIGGFSEDAIFRGQAGGEDVAFMQVIIDHCQPIGRIERACYRVWSRAGAHVDRFLANTRLAGASFEFVNLHASQLPGGGLEKSILDYVSKVGANLQAGSL